MIGATLSILILLPIFIGILSLGIRNSLIRAITVILTSVILIVFAVIGLLSFDFPVSYTPSGLAVWEIIVTVFNFGIMAFFILIAIRDMVKRGLSKHNVLVLLFTLTAGIPLAVFEFGQFHGHSVEPAFYIDHLTIALVLVISIVGSLISIFALRYMQDHEKHLHHSGELKGTRQPRFFFFLIAFLGVMNGLVFSNNLLWMAFFWEVTTLCCWGLISHDGTDIAKTNALRALWMCLIGSTAFTIAIMLLWNGPLASLSLTDLVRSNMLQNNPALYLPVAFLALAAFTKSAQLPFQNWLLGAMVAPYSCFSVVAFQHHGQCRRLSAAKTGPGLSRHFHFYFYRTFRRLCFHDDLLNRHQPKQCQKSAGLLDHCQPGLDCTAGRHQYTAFHRLRHYATGLPCHLQSPAVPGYRHNRAIYRQPRY
jgi:ech hydrogenase subunit A